jgi:hypothetical protein
MGRNRVGSTAGSKPALGAIAMGMLTALLGYLAALAHGMGTAPSGWGGWMAIALMLLGCTLALVGVASIWMERLKPAASIGAQAAIILLVGAFIVDKAVIALQF